MALENIVGAPGERRRWMLAFAFGLIHGFGFAFALQDTLQFAGARLFTALISFNVGVELGQLLVVAALAPVLGALFRFVVEERKGAIVVSALVAHTSWHWLTERADALGRYGLDWAGFALRWTALSAIVAAAAWFAFRWIRRRAADQPRAKG